MMRRMVYEGGWKSLVAKYKTKKEPKDINARYLKIRSTNIEGSGTNKLIRFYKTPEGLLLKLNQLLGKHPYNVFIPWKEIVEVREKKILFFKTKRLIIGQPFVTFIDLREQDFEKIKEDILTKSNFRL